MDKLFARLILDNLDNAHLEFEIMDSAEEQPELVRSEHFKGLGTKKQVISYSCRISDFQ